MELFHQEHIAAFCKQVPHYMQLVPFLIAFTPASSSLRPTVHEVYTLWPVLPIRCCVVSENWLGSDALHVSSVCFPWPRAISLSTQCCSLLRKSITKYIISLMIHRLIWSLTPSWKNGWTLAVWAIWARMRALPSLAEPHAQLLLPHCSDGLLRDTAGKGWACFNIPVLSSSLSTHFHADSAPLFPDVPSGAQTAQRCPRGRCWRFAHLPIVFSFWFRIFSSLYFRVVCCRVHC